MNFSPDGEWGTKECRNERVLKFMEQRHYLALARQHGEDELTEKITRGNRFFVRLTNMVRSMDPTTKILLAHYGRHYKRGEPGSLADLIFNIVLVRNTMSKEIVKMCAEEQIPWLHVEQGKVAEQSKKDADAMFLAWRPCLLSQRPANELPRARTQTRVGRVRQRTRELRNEGWRPGRYMVRR